MATSEGRVPQSMYDVLYLVNEAGYRLENLNPTAEGYYFAWDSEGQKMVYIKEDLDTVMYPEDYTIDKSKCWITVGDQEEAERVAKAGYNLYLEKTIELIRLVDCAVSIDTGAYKLTTLEINGTSVDPKSIVLSGNFGTMSVGIANVNSTVTGSIKTLNVSGNNAAMSINGNVNSVTSSLSNSINMGSTGYIGSVNGGSVVTGSGSLVSSGSATGASNGIVKVGDKEDIENIRTQIAGGRNFEGETITIANDINMAGIAFQPVSNYDRDHKSAAETKNWFQGTFDGNNKTIKGFSTNGFAIAGLNSGTNNSSVPFGSATNIYSEAVYGLFGTVYVPEGETVTIKNLTIEAAIDMVLDEANKYVGDSVGGLIGFVYGKGTLNIENVTVTGYVNAYDGVSAFIGRAYGEADSPKLTVNFINCTNNATVTGVRKTGAFLGSGGTTNKCNINFTNCVNNGNITCQGLDKDIELAAYRTASGVTKLVSAEWCDMGYYKAGASTYNQVGEVTNNGVVKVGK